MTRKGQQLVDWTVPMACMVIAVAVLALLVNYYDSRSVDAAELQAAAYANRIHYDDIIMYRDSTGRVYPGIINASKLTATVLDEHFNGTMRISSIAAKLEILGAETCNVPLRTIYNDKRTFEERLPFASNRVRGPGSATLHVETMPVVIRTDRDCAATLRLTMVRPNS